MKIFALGDRDPAYLTHREIDAALALMPPEAGCDWVATDSAQARDLGSADGIWLLPGTPYRDDEVAYAAIRHCLSTGTPLLATCGGFQYVCVHFARTRAGVPEAAHAETDPDSAHQVVVPLRCSLYGEQRLVTPVEGTRLAAICGREPFDGFHFCGYGLADDYAQRLQASGVVIGAHAEDAGVEAVELADHPFFVATAFQPQVGSSESGVLHPLIAAFLEAVAERRAAVR